MHTLLLAASGNNKSTVSLSDVMLFNVLKLYFVNFVVLDSNEDFVLVVLFHLMSIYLFHYFRVLITIFPM
jgi:hypothetical protein